MIHHETFSAKSASEDGGEGQFNVIEQHDGFHVVDGGSGMYLSRHTNLRAACSAAKREAREYDIWVREKHRHALPSK